MATYTMTIRDMLMDYVSNYEGLTRNEVQMLNTNDLINKGQKYIFDFPYPILKEHQNRIEQKFLFVNFMNEIGQETPALFKHFLQANLMLVSGRYNLMYKLHDKEIDPFLNFNYTEEGIRESDGTSEGTSTSSDRGKNSFNNEGNVRNWNIPIDVDINYESENPATASATEDSGKTESESSNVNSNSTKGKSKEENRVLKKGMQGVNVVDVIIKYQNEVFDVDMMLINDDNIRQLFMGVR